jgi:hypothetical protein
MQLKESSCRIHIPPFDAPLVRYFLTSRLREPKITLHRQSTLINVRVQIVARDFGFPLYTFTIYSNGYTRLGRPTNCKPLCFLQPSHTRPENSVVVPERKTVSRSLVCSIGPRSLRPQAHYNAFWALLPPSLCPIRLISDFSEQSCCNTTSISSKSRSQINRIWICAHPVALSPS